MIDQEYEANVADQFVTVDNDALFKCQLPPQVRDIFQVIGWLEDGQQLVATSATNQLANLFASSNSQSSTIRDKDTRRPRDQQQRAVVMLPNGHLYIQRVQMKEANRSYKCQVRNLLSGRVSSSAISGRLFVTGESNLRVLPAYDSLHKPTVRFLS